MFIIAKKDQKASPKILVTKKKYDEIIPFHERISLDIADVVDHYEKIKAAYNRIYYVSEGVMHVSINDELFTLGKGDGCFVEKGMILALQGTFSVIVVSHPPLVL